MSDDADADRPDADVLPACPRCERPVARVTMVGPADAVAGPCGCRVAPGLLTDSN